MPRGRTNNSAARGYGGEHQAQRTAWEPTVQAGNAVCHAIVCLMPTRAIAPGEPWDLGHTPDRTAWTGPEHRRCNRSEGARRGNAGRAQTQGGPPPHPTPARPSRWIL